jgi:hypothetical protein
MPEAAVYKYNFLFPGKDKVGFSGQVFTMKPETIAHAMNK